MAFNVISTINLDMAKPNVNVVNAVQYDSSGRVVKANLFNNGEAWQVPSGVYPVIRFKKSDRMGGFYDTDENNAYAISFENNRATINITLALQVLTTAGNVDVQINFYNSLGIRVTAFSFRVKVQASVIPDEKIVSSDYFNALTVAISSASGVASDLEADYEEYRTSLQSLVTQAQMYVGAPRVANTASEMSNTSYIYVYTGSETGYNNGHWYYYNGQSWADGGAYNSSALVTDKTLSVENMAADAKVVGDKISNLSVYDGRVDKADGKVLALFESGAINNNTGANVPQTARIRTTEYLPTGIVIKANDAIKVRAVFYRENKTFGVASTFHDLAQGESWQASNSTYPYVRFFMGYQDDRTITASNIKDAVKSMEITYGDTIYNDIDSLQRDLSLVTGNVIADYEIGGINASNGQDAVSTNRIRTSNYLPNNLLIRNSVPNSKIVGIFYNANKELYAAGSWHSESEFTLVNANASYIRLVFRYDNDADVTDTDVSLFSDSTKIIALGYESALMFRGNIVKKGFSDVFDLKQNGYYSFSQRNISSITNLPPDISNGGIIQVYEVYASGVTGYRVQDTAGNEWLSLSHQKYWIKTNDALTDETELINISWEIGSIASSTGDDASTSSRLRSDFIDIRNGLKLRLPSDMAVGVWAYNDSNYIGYLGYYYESLNLYPKYDMTRVRLTIAKQVDGTMSSDAFSDTSFAQKLWISRINRTGKVNWIAFGDSITEGYYSANGQIAGPTLFGYPYFVAKENNWVLRNYGVGGSGWIKRSDSLDKPNAMNLIKNMSFSNVDLVTFAYGINDWHYNQNIGSVSDSPSIPNLNNESVQGNSMAANMKYCIEKVLKSNPLCKIVVITPNNCSAYGGTFETNWGLGTSLTTSGTLQHVIDVIKDICEYYGIEYIESSTVSPINRYNIQNVLSDGLHPIIEMHPVIGRNLSKQIHF